MPDSVAELIADSPLAKNFLQRFEELPGWSYLGFVLTMAAAWAPRMIRALDSGREVSPFVITVGVFGATYVLYFAGDWFDDHFWKRRVSAKIERDDRFTDAWLDGLETLPVRRAIWRALGAPSGVASTHGPRTIARSWLGVTTGSYKIALTIARSAEASLDYGVWWPNEVAKTSRSFIIPLGGAAVVAAITGHAWIALGLLVIAVLAIRLYVTLKFAHVRRLYVAVNRCRQEGSVRFDDHCLVDGRTYRIFIVDKTHVVAKALG